MVSSLVTVMRKDLGGTNTTRSMSIGMSKDCSRVKVKKGSSRLEFSKMLITGGEFLDASSDPLLTGMLK